jgi:hypothetical protein
MTPGGREFDPDDNFAHDGDGAAFDEDADTEALVWQLLLLVNPGDEEAALQQFSAWQEAVAGTGAEDADAVLLLTEVIDWKSGFHVRDDDAGSLVDCLTELAARWNVHIDWGVEDPTDAGFLAGAELPSLLGVAFDRLREHGYTLWTWDTGNDAIAGWIASSRDDMAMHALAQALGIALRMAVN